jgi:L-amino acid N-acyltransferase YncA
MGEKKRRQGAGGPTAAPLPKTELPQTGLVVRPAFEADLDQITVIYHHHVMTGTGTFDLDPPDLAAMTQRWSKIAAQGWPFLVACAPHQFSRVLGYAYAQPFRERRAYAQTFETSIYTAPFQQGRGVGKVLLRALMDDCAAIGVRELVAVIGDSNNMASIGLHQAAGFWPSGQLLRVGQKFGRWLDVVLMQRSLTPGRPT